MQKHCGGLPKPDCLEVNEWLSRAGSQRWACPPLAIGVTPVMKSAGRSTDEYVNASTNLHFQIVDGWDAD